MSKQTQLAQKEVNAMMKQLHYITESENKKQQKEASNLEKKMAMLSNQAKRFQTTGHSKSNSPPKSKSSPSPVSARRKGVERTTAIKKTSFKRASPSSTNRIQVRKLFRLRNGSNSNKKNSNSNNNLANNNNYEEARQMVKKPSQSQKKK